MNSEVEMSLYEDQTGTGVKSGRLNVESAFNSKKGIIDRQLSVGNYIVVIRSKVRETQYSLQLINNTSQAIYLYEDQGGNGVISGRLDIQSAFKDKPAIIKRNLSVGHYIVVVEFKARDTYYNLTISAP